MAAKKITRGYHAYPATAPVKKPIQYELKKPGTSKPVGSKPATPAKKATTAPGKSMAKAKPAAKPAGRMKRNTSQFKRK